MSCTRFAKTIAVAVMTSALFASSTNGRSVAATYFGPEPPPYALQAHLSIRPDRGTLAEELLAIDDGVGVDRLSPANFLNVPSPLVTPSWCDILQDQATLTIRSTALPALRLVDAAIDKLEPLTAAYREQWLGRTDELPTLVGIVCQQVRPLPPIHKELRNDADSTDGDPQEAIDLARQWLHDGAEREVASLDLQAFATSAGRSLIDGSVSAVEAEAAEDRVAAESKAAQPETATAEAETNDYPSANYAYDEYGDYYAAESEIGQPNADYMYSYEEPYYPTDEYEDTYEYEDQYADDYPEYYDQYYAGEYEDDARENAYGYGEYGYDEYSDDGCEDYEDSYQYGDEYEDDYTAEMEAEYGPYAEYDDGYSEYGYEEYGYGEYAASGEYGYDEDSYDDSYHADDDGESEYPYDAPRHEDDDEYDYNEYGEYAEYEYNEYQDDPAEYGRNSFGEYGPEYAGEEYATYGYDGYADEETDLAEGDYYPDTEAYEDAYGYGYPHGDAYDHEAEDWEDETSIEGEVERDAWKDGATINSSRDAVAEAVEPEDSESHPAVSDDVVDSRWGYWGSESRADRFPPVHEDLAADLPPVHEDLAADLPPLHEGLAADSADEHDLQAGSDDPRYAYPDLSEADLLFETEAYQVRQSEQQDREGVSGSEKSAGHDDTYEDGYAYEYEYACPEQAYTLGFWRYDAVVGNFVWEDGRGRSQGERPEANELASDPAVDGHSSEVAEREAAMEAESLMTDLFIWLPDELLLPCDKELLRELNLMMEERTSVRRAMLSDYIEQLGPMAVEFVRLYNFTTDRDALELCDDLPGVAALLAVYRMVEINEMSERQGVDALRTSLNCLPSVWVDDVSAIIVRPSFEQATRPAEDSPNGERADGGRPATALLRLTLHSAEGARAIFGDLVADVLSAPSKLRATIASGDWPAVCSAPVRGWLSR